MDAYILGQRIMTNFGVCLGGGMAYYATNALRVDLDICSFGREGARSILFGTFTGDVTECRNGPGVPFRTFASGGNDSATVALLGFLLIQMLMAMILVGIDTLHYRLRMLSQVTFLSLIQTVWHWLTVPCYIWVLALLLHGLSVSCSTNRGHWKDAFSNVKHLPTPNSCQDAWMYRWTTEGHHSFSPYISFNMSFLAVLGLCLSLLFHILNMALLMPQSLRWIKDFKTSFSLARHPVFHIRRPGEEEDF